MIFIVYLFIFTIIQGGSMAQYVKLRGNLTETEVQKYSAQILSGLDYLHKNNIIHRDIKGMISTNISNSNVLGFICLKSLKKVQICF